MKVIIPDGVTSIGNSAFEYWSFLTSVAIPNSVTSIGNWAFYKCTSLENVTIGNSVTSIGDYAFCYCSSLENITIPDSVTSIGEGVFHVTPKVCITCNPFSVAEEYAFKNGIPCNFIEKDFRENMNR